MLNPDDLYWLERRLEIATNDTIKDRFNLRSTLDLLNALVAKMPGNAEIIADPSGSGEQIVTIGDKTVKFGPLASNEEIVAALQNPFVPTANTTVKMTSPLQGLGQKLSKLKHDSELDAQKLSDRIDAVAARKDAALSKTHGALDGQEKDIADVEGFVAEIEKATNGGPA